MDREKLISVFKLLADAGEAILEIYKKDNFQTKFKSDNSPVTIADIASGKIINKGLKNLFPDTPIINEENKIPDFEERNNWDEFFLVDPLDGTKEFIKGNGEFCINLALINGTQSASGWIYQPLLRKGWYCKKGEGIFEFDSKGGFTRIIQSEKTSGIIRMVTSRSSSNNREAGLINEIRKKYPVEIIHKGSSLKQVEMVLGNADMYLKAGICSEWDIAPGQLMVEEFGGSVLQLDNFESLRYNKPVLLNPHFVMLNSRLNTPGFISFLKNVVLQFQ